VLLSAAVLNGSKAGIAMAEIMVAQTDGILEENCIIDEVDDNKKTWLEAELYMASLLPLLIGSSVKQSLSCGWETPNSLVNAALT
jgi:hypothetical protein